MIQMLWRWIEEIRQQYNNPVERRRALGLTALNVVVMAFLAVLLIVDGIIPLL